MIKLAALICILLASAYYLDRIAGISLLKSGIRNLLELLFRYRMPDNNYGFYNLMELDHFSKKLSPFFTAVTGLKLYFDEYGWQYAEYQVVTSSLDDENELRQAIAVEARNYIKTAHGYDNPDIFVPVLCKDFICIKIACSPKAHELAAMHDFSEPQKKHGTIDEFVD